MKNFIIFVLLSTSILFADVEPNSSCQTSEVVSLLDGAKNSVSYGIEGSIVGLKKLEGEDRPPYEKDFYNFTVQSDGELTISYNADGKAYFRIGTNGCGSRNIVKEFGKPVTKSFRVSKGERVDILTYCRYGGDYTIDIDFKSDTVSDPILEDNSTKKKNLTFTITIEDIQDEIISADYQSGILTINSGNESKKITINVDGKKVIEQKTDFLIELTQPKSDEPLSISSKMDIEPNNSCSQSELIVSLDNIDSVISYQSSGLINSKEDGDSDGKSMDYYHFTPNTKGKLIINATANKPLWFALSDNGCHQEWDDDWNIQRGVSKSINKTIDVVENQEINLLVLSYSNKEYKFDILFMPEE